jgi:hypothetical protein|tara:strand:+ start:3557 stop:3889 length:333 start_codon:yes stop_codon:yes gene_type:complete
MKYVRLSVLIKKIPTKEHFKLKEDLEQVIESEKSKKEDFKYKITRMDAGWVLENYDVVLAGDEKHVKAVRDRIVEFVKPRYRGGWRKRYIIKLSKIRESEGPSINIDSDL